MAKRKNPGDNNRHKVSLKISVPPEKYPKWLKAVYLDFQKMINATRIDPRLTAKEVVDLGTMTERICEYIYLSVEHFASISTLSTEEMGDVDVLKILIKKYKEAVGTTKGG